MAARIDQNPMQGKSGFWFKQPLALTLLVHVAINVAVPTGLMAIISFAKSQPALLKFALVGIAPWTALSSAIIVWHWYKRGRAGQITEPPQIMRNVLPLTLGWAAIFALLSLGLSSFATGQLQPLSALDGGISAFMASLMSGIAISKQAHAAHKNRDY